MYHKITKALTGLTRGFSNFNFEVQACTFNYEEYLIEILKEKYIPIPIDLNKVITLTVYV